MPYLSRIRINPLRTASRHLLANPRALHGAVQGGLPTAPEQERTLWRLDSDNPRRPHLYVLTQSKPDWTHLTEQAGWPDADGEHYTIRDYTPLLSQLALGREFAFRLTASPVQNTNRPLKPTENQKQRLEQHLKEAENGGTHHLRGFRTGHRTAATQLEWFLTRTQRWGFDIPEAPGLTDTHDAQGRPPRDVRITTRNRHSFSKTVTTAHTHERRHTAREDRVVVRTATFEGRLHITDPALFRNHLLSGIGPSKAYGCGLLTLAPLTAGA
ncbi:type I-E CRISPR-associated protein Cas6/Cse3/CasE [Streptomyces sp. NPDC050560]|uniref:type I-E CRISPR-associated protein Cas6/Cse3/CasE n=1 Tax=Streptomyces sp. NPDC050560 TaxID=3365630 RepID=UPI003788517F